MNDYYIDFETMEPVINKIEERKRGSEPAPISVKNKAKKSIDFSSSRNTDRFNQPSSPTYSENRGFKLKDIPIIDYVDMNAHHKFYNAINDESNFVISHILSIRELRR